MSWTVTYWMEPTMRRPPVLKVFEGPESRKQAYQFAMNLDPHMRIEIEEMVVLDEADDALGG